MKRFVSLDGLRGLAALIVMLFHFSMVPPGINDRLRGSLAFAPFVAGESAVYVFFVLSGFVLYASFVGKDGAAVAPFIVKRLARIYPPVFVVVLLSAACLFLFNGAVPGTSKWLARSWSTPPSSKMVIANGLLLSPDFTLDIVLWSLAVEVEMSLVFPAVVAVVKRLPVFSLVASFLLSLACRVYAGRHDIFWPAHPLVVGRYLFLFVAGAVTARNSARIQDVLRRLGTPASLAAAFIALVLTSLSPNRHGAVPTSIGAAMLVLLIGHAEPLARAFSIAPLRFLGEISYSLYLVHLIIILAVVHAGAGLLPMGTLLAMAFVGSFVAAVVLNALVERPSIHLGRRSAALAQRIAPVRPSATR